MKIHALLHASRANGPGLRSVLWVQGCTLACPGCWNPDTHPAEAGEEVNPEELAERIVREAPKGTEGITISGGEPMQQAGDLYRFICMIRALRPDWSIGMFTGYGLGELNRGEYDPRDLAYDQRMRGVFWNHSLRPSLDFAITGRYEARRADPADRADLIFRRSVSSANQDIVLFSRRYTWDDFPPLTVQIAIGQDGMTQITGFPLTRKV